MQEDVELRALEQEYDQACWDDCQEVERRTGYPATYWKSAMRAHGAVEASVQLIRRGGGTPQSGFLKLLELGLPERSVEYSVLRLRWRAIFANYPDVMDLARTILRKAEITPPDELPEPV